MDADANTELIRRRTKTRGQGGERRLAASLNVESRRHRHLSMLLDLNWKVEDCHQAVAHLLVHDAIVRPDGLSALALKYADDFTQLDRVHPLGQAGIAADIGEQDGNDSGDVLVFLDAAEGTFADCANIRVHLALRDAENSERHREWTADRDWHSHLIPAASADKSMVRSGPMHLTTISPNDASHSSPRVATGTRSTLVRGMSENGTNAKSSDVRFVAAHGA